MKKFGFYLLLGLFFVVGRANAQKTNVPNTNKSSDEITIGAGLGLDYGGIGLNLTFYPVKNLGLFLGGGYTTTGIGINGGAKVRFFPNEENQNSLYFLGMYGYNTIVEERAYYGMTFGGGFDFKFFPKQKIGYWTLALLYPIRNHSVYDYVDNIFPITFSIGYRFNLN